MKRFFILIRNTVLYLLLGAVLVTVAAGIKGINIGDIFSDNSDTGAPSEDTHIYLKNVEQGSCKKLVGNVACTVIFVNDTESGWTPDAESEAKKALVDQELMLEAEASKHGVTLDINYYYQTASVNVKIPISSDDSSWLDAAVESAGLDPFDSAPGKLKKKYSADEAPIVLLSTRKADQTHISNTTTQRNTARYTRAIWTPSLTSCCICSAQMTTTIPLPLLCSASSTSVTAS